MNMLDQLTEREKLILLLGIVVITVMGLFLIVRSVYNFRKELTETVNETASQSTQLDRIIADYNYYKALKSGGADEDISQMYSKLDQIMIRYNLKDRVSTMKDTSANIERNYIKLSIEISFRSVQLYDVIKFIYDIEKNKQINGKIDYFDMGKPFQDKELYDVNLRISSFKKNQGAK